MPAQQRRGAKIALNASELDDFVREQRTCRVGTVAADGRPHVSPLWFVWDGSAIWLNSIVKSQRWTNIMRDGRVSVLIDAGVEFTELIGVELIGVARSIGEVPRTGEPFPQLEEPERLFANKYAGSDEMHYDERHAWLQVVPDKIVSWDFRKMFPG